MDFLSWFIAVLFVVILWSLAVIGMRRSWKKRASRQRDFCGNFYLVPDKLGDYTIEPIPGIYAGSVVPAHAGERCVLGDSGFRSSAKLSGYSQGILCERPDLESIWIPRSAIVDIRIGKIFAGKVPPGGVLIIRHILAEPVHISAQYAKECAVIETGFRVDPQVSHPGYARWIEIYRPEKPVLISES